MDLFKDLVKANTSDGRVNGVLLALVADVNDPLKLQRIQAYDQTKGGQSTTDWLFRCLPHTQYNPPVPKVGDCVIISFIDGDPHKGVYLGVITNQVNPAVGSDSDLTMVLGGVTVTLDPEGRASVKGAKEVTIQTDRVTIYSKEATIGADSFNISADKVTYSCQSFKVNGKEVVTVGATDTRGDTIVYRGW